MSSGQPATTRPQNLPTRPPTVQEAVRLWLAGTFAGAAAVVATAYGCTTPLALAVMMSGPQPESWLLLVVGAVLLGGSIGWVVQLFRWLPFDPVFRRCLPRWRWLAPLGWIGGYIGFVIAAAHEYTTFVAARHPSYTIHGTEILAWGLLVLFLLDTLLMGVVLWRAARHLPSQARPARPLA